MNHRESQIIGCIALLRTPHPLQDQIARSSGKCTMYLGLFVTGPWDVLLAWRKRHADRVRARDEVAVLSPARRR
jgi:hypothetical protein